MKSGSQVRSPAIVSSNSQESKDMPVGEVLRKAKKDLFFGRMLVAILVVVVVTFIVVMILNGNLNINEIVDKIIAFME